MIAFSRGRRFNPSRVPTTPIRNSTERKGTPKGALLAGSKRGGADKRHLWPTWKTLIEKRRPAIVFGEQVKSAIAFGWMDETFSDLEECEYACAAAVLPALCGQKGHERQRLWFVAHPEDAYDYGRPGEIQGAYELEAKEGPEKRIAELGCSSEVGFIQCPDGLLRQSEPGIPLLVDGIQGSLDAEINFGDAIVLQVAAEFIRPFVQL